MSNDPSSHAIGQIAITALLGYDTDKIIAVGVKVATALREFREKHPEKVPKRVSNSIFSLFDKTPHPVPDFALALHLADVVDDPAMSRIRHAAGDIDILLAYLLVMVCIDDHSSPTHIGLDEALKYTLDKNGTSLAGVREQVRRLQPLAKHGEAFIGNRKQGRLSPVATKIKAHMRSNPAAKTEEVWEALKRHPPKGHDFRESPRFGKYIEVGARPVMKWGRFRNLVSLHRPKK